MCDHTLMIHHDNLITQSELKEYLINEAREWTASSKQMAWLRSDESWKETKPLDFLDRRKGYTTMFNHCPDCGSKVDWRKIKQEI